MVSGTIINDFRTGYRLQIAWNVNSQDIANNTSNVTASVQLVSTGSSYSISSSASKNVSLTINGTTYSGTCTVGLSANQTKTLFTVTTDVAHNSDGTKTCSFSCDLGLNVTLSGTYWGNISASGSGDFDTIPRASSISGFLDFTIGSAISVTIARASPSFTHKLHLYVGNTFVKEWTDIEDVASLTLTDTEQNTIYSAIPNSTTVTMTLYCLTYSGSIQIGDWVSRQATASVGSSIVPSFTTVTHSEATSTVSTIVGKYVQSLSKLNLAITGAVGAKYSTISSYQITFDGSTYNSSTATSGNIKSSGTLTLTGKITDSRGRTATKSVTVTVLAYSVPQITTFTLSRCNSDGTANDLGTYAKVISSGIVSSLLNTIEKNSLTYKILSKARSVSTWTTNKSQTLVNLSLSATDVLGTYDAISSFDFRLEITDRFNTTISLNVLPTGEVALSYGKKSIGVGKVWERGTLDVGGDTYISGKLNVGEVDATANATANAITVRDSNADINVRLLRSNFANQATISGAMAFRINNTTDNYTRYCSDVAAIRTFLGIDLTTLTKYTDFSNSKATNGYQKLANGLILQWGTASTVGGADTPVSFPIAYPNACVFVSTNPYQYGTWTSNFAYTKTGFMVAVGDTPLVNVTWFAIGY